MAGALSDRFDPLRVARLQDALGWLTLALLLALAPWARPWELLQLPRPSPEAAWITAGAALAVAAVALLRSSSARALHNAAVANGAAAVGVAAWWAATTPAQGPRGTLALAAIVASLVIQAAFDLLMLHEARATRGG